MTTKTRVASAALLCAVALLLAGCSGSKPTTTPDPAPTVEEEQDDVVINPGPLPHESVDDQDSDLTYDTSALYAVLSATPETKGSVEVIQQGIERFIRAQFDPLLLSGQWRDEARSVPAVFSGAVSEELLADISDLDTDSADDMYALSSLGAFFLPTSSITVPAQCVATSMRMSDCLLRDVVVGGVTVSGSDVNKKTVKIDLTVASARRLVLMEGEEQAPAQSSVSFADTLWVDVRTGLVVSCSNSFDFGEVAAM